MAMIRGIGGERFTGPGLLARSERLFVAFLVFLVGSMPGIARPMPSFVSGLLPFPARIEAVISQGAIQGYPVSVAKITATLPHDRALAITRDAWRASAAIAPILEQSGPWQVLSMREPGWFVTLQLRQARSGGTEGLLSIWSDSVDSQAQRALGFDPVRILPSGSQVLQRISSADPGLLHTTLVAVARSSAAWVLQAIDATAKSMGFVRQQMALESPSSSAARLNRSGERELGITVNDTDQGTAMVIHITENN
ncbi:MAG: hypothetical protein VW339_14920 [Quisquiliibacterium sp.]